MIFEYSNTYKDENGTEIEIRLKAERPTDAYMRETLRFIPSCAQSFYLEVAEKLNNEH